MSDIDENTAYLAGMYVERERIISLFYYKEGQRNIIDRLAYPYTAQELEETIREGAE
jgi:hypothetical protein